MSSYIILEVIRFGQLSTKNSELSVNSVNVIKVNNKHVRSPI